MAKKRTTTKSKVKASIPRKGTVEVDLSGVSAAARKRRTVIEDGVYLARVSKVETTTFSSGSKGVVWVFELEDAGKYNGTPFWYNNVLVDQDGNPAENSLWSFRGVLQALDPRVKIPDKAFKTTLSKFVDRHVALEIVLGEDNNGKPRSEINDVFHPELMDEEEEDEEDDDLDEDEDDDELDDEEEEEEEDDDEEEDDEVDLEDEDDLDEDEI